MPHEESIVPPRILPPCGNLTSGPAYRLLLWLFNRSATGIVLTLRKAMLAVILALLVFQAQAQFPVVATTNTSYSSSISYIHVVALPSGIQAGDLLLVFWADGDTASTVNVPGGWTQLYNQQTGGYRQLVIYKIASGSEGAVIVLSTSIAERSAHNSYRIATGTYSGIPVAASVQIGFTDQPDPPLLTSGFGAISTLWIAVSHSGGDDNTPAPAPPSSYTNLITGYTGSAGTKHARMATARRNLAAASENPAVFTLGSQIFWGANTVAIKGCNNATLQLTSGPGTDSQAVCWNEAITTITYAVGGSATGAGATGLPAGLATSYSAGIFSISGTPTATGTFNYTVTTTGTPSPCSEASATGTIVVNPMPTITCPVNIAANIDAGQCYATISNLGTPVVNAGCGIAAITNDAPASNQYPVGITIVTWTVEDLEGNTASCQQTITVTDNEDPWITCPANQSRSTNTDSCSYTATGTEFDATAFGDNCAGSTVSYILTGATTGTGSTSLAGVLFNTGTTTVGWTVTDASGNSALCSFTITVNDQQGPVITCPEDLTAATGTEACIANVFIPAPAYSDNCSVSKLTWTMTGATVASSPSTGINIIPLPYVFNGGVTTVTYYAEDPSGNSASCDFTVTVVDGQPPVFSNCPGDIIVNAPADQCSAEVAFSTPEAIDNCTGVTVTQTSGPPSGSSFPIGNTTIVFTATDLSGNTSICTFEIMVIDATPPAITVCPNDTMIVINNNCAITIPYGTLGLPSATDLCSPPVTITNDYPPDGLFLVGITYVTYTATDTAGNSSTCVQTVILTRGIVIVDYNYIQYPAPYPITVTGTLLPDNTAPGVNSWQSFSTVALSSGRTRIVNDGVAPGPAAFLQHDNVEPCIHTDAQVPGNEDPSFYYQFDMENLGTSYISYYLYFQFKRQNASNPKNLYVAWSIDGINYDTSLTIPITIQQFPNNTWKEIYQSLVGITELNNSSVVSFRIYFENQGNPLAYFDNFQYVALNEEIQVAEAIPTNVECPDDTDGSIEIINTSPGTWQYTIDGGISWQEEPYFPNLGVGIYDVRMRMEEMLECDVVINVALEITDNDSIPPVITYCPPDTVASANNPENNAALITLDPLEFEDNCTLDENMLIVWVMTGATVDSDTGMIPNDYPFLLGLTYVTYTITDESDNTSECSFTVLVLTIPEISCPDDWLIETYPGECQAELYPGYPTVNESAGDITITWEMTGATTGSGTGPIGAYFFNGGITYIEWTATNAFGSDSCIQTITVADNQAPEFSNCPAAPFDLGCNPAVLPDESMAIDDAGAVTDNCPEPVLSASGGAITGTCIKTQLWTVTATDTNIYNLTATCQVTYTWTDDQLPPVITCPDSVEVIADMGETYATVSLDPPVYSDNCTAFEDISITWTMTGATTGSGTGIIPVPFLFNTGTTLITYTVTDECGNSNNCQFIVIVNPYEPPEISCPDTISSNTGDGLCTAALSPGFPVLISGSEPIIYTWTMTGATTASGTGPIIPDPFTFNAGETTITWIATNISGADTCYQVINVVDAEPPDFTAPEPVGFCVQNIDTASWNFQPMPDTDITPDRPDWYILDGTTELDITNISDNCCDEEDITILWTIIFSNSYPPVSGIGQPSLYGPITLWGNTDYTAAVHTITYVLVDCQGNLSDPVSVNITINPRPNVINEY